MYKNYESMTDRRAQARAQSGARLTRGAHHLPVQSDTEVTSPSLKRDASATTEGQSSHLKT